MVQGSEWSSGRGGQRLHWEHVKRPLLELTPASGPGWAPRASRLDSPRHRHANLQQTPISSRHSARTIILPTVRQVMTPSPIREISAIPRRLDTIWMVIYSLPWAREIRAANRCAGNICSDTTCICTFHCYPSLRQARNVYGRRPRLHQLRKPRSP